MIVCHCRGVTDRTIRTAIRDGARSRRQVARACDAGRRCGGCRPVIDELLQLEGEEDAAPALGALAGAGVAAR